MRREGKGKEGKMSRKPSEQRLLKRVSRGVKNQACHS